MVANVNPFSFPSNSDASQAASQTIDQKLAEFQFDSVDAALADLAAGKAIVVVDDENRENEGDVVCAAQFATPDMINFMAVEARGLICLAMTGDRLDELDLPLMVSGNGFEDENEQTAFTISIDASLSWGVTTGISAEDRARTIQVAINPEAKPQDLRRPGHIFPLRAKEGGVLKRAGHTEAGVDLSKLARLYPASVICEIQNADGSMARLPELIDYAKNHSLKLISIADLISYRLRHERLVKREAVADLPTQFGKFQIYAYRNLLDNSEHVAIVKGNPDTFGTQPVMVRVHSECLTGDALGSLRCDCQLQLQTALKMIENAETGIVVYLRQEGRGIGLVNKLKAYSLQDMGFDTVEANEKLGLPADQRNYGIGAQILNDLGVHQFKLITNNPRKIAGLKGYGLEMVDRMPLLIEANTYNSDYLSTKAHKLGHLLLRSYLGTLALHWAQPLPSAERYEKVNSLRQLAHNSGLLLQEEARSIAVSLFSPQALIVNLGLAEPVVSNWYQQPDHQYRGAIATLLEQLIQWSDLEELDLLIANGSDPFTTLQVGLDRQIFSWQSPDVIGEQLSTQRIYSFSRHSVND
ncbi:bifunctional 3,4-dihydroxy-2-butanone-4-phosphate synthase/GTP cyclohydrolase II [Leptothoe sp. ISB3NOV94-8A]|uniref:bifunctional 3,4-dihydroxy-2-butanone-4-phosphate synthase/GTP cyclohydrolase II n=1 Tax=Adonisia turfae TaxID=2950184 RepID=UPI00372F9E73